MASSTSRSDATAPLTTYSTLASPISSPASSFRSDDSSTPSRRPRPRNATLARTISFTAAILCALCAGSITVFSLYAPIFQQRLRYSQFQVNGIAIAASLALYLPVPLFGLFCDRAGPAPLALLAAVLFSAGYGLAAFLYRRALAAADAALGLGRHVSGPSSTEYGLMIAAFVGIGIATCAMYLAAVATCAKNFGRGKHRGLALALPIAAYGLSGMWMSQFASRVLREKRADGSVGEEVDVFAFFVFLAVLLAVVGVIGSATLRVIGEDEFIEEAVEEMERSGLLDSSVVFTPGRSRGGYGTLAERGNPFDDGEGGIGQSQEDDDAEEAKARKKFVLNAETGRFLSDHTMWLFALGFFFMIGPGEAFINNLGTVIRTLYPPPEAMVSDRPPTSAATHVSIVGITSTVARLLTGTLTDILAPSPLSQHVQLSTSSLSRPSSFAFLRSRVSFLLLSAVILAGGLVTLASGAVQGHGDKFWIVSGLVGAGYGAVFSLTPIIITVIWGVENFATNWGIVAMFPALGSTLWGMVYSAVYQAGANGNGRDQNEMDNMCYGAQCYAKTFWAMAVSVCIACVLVLLAWKGRNGWVRRGIVV